MANIYFRFGRTRALLVFLLIECLCGAVGAYSVNLYMFLATRFLMGIAGINTISIALVLGKLL